MTVYRSMRGELIDIDLIKIKSKISKQDKSVGVIKRESFVKGKRKRISRKRIEEMINNDDLLVNKKEVEDVLELENIIVESSEDDNSTPETTENNIHKPGDKDIKPVKTIKRDRK